jgi:hypothetical protein
MALNPSISLGVRPLELANPLAQYGQVAAIQSAQNQNQLAQYQLGAAQRAEQTQNVLADAYNQSIDPDTGKINYNKLTGLLAKGGGGAQIPGIEKTRREIEAAALAAQKTKSEIEKNEFQLTKDKLKHGWTSLGDAPTSQDAIKKLNEGVTKGYFDFATASAETQRLQNMTPEQYKQYRVEKVLGLLDAKDKLSFMLPKTARQDIGGQIVNIQDNPMMPGYGMPIAGGAIAKTPTFAEQTGQGQLNLARAKFDFEKANPTMSIQEDPSGLLAVNTRTGVATPVVYGPTGFQAAPAAAPGASMMRQPPAALPGQRAAAIPGMASVLDQTAMPLVAQGGERMPGMPVAGKEKPMTETQSNATAYGMRMKEANAILEDLSKKGVLKGAVIEATPLIGGTLGQVLPSVLGGTSAAQQQVNQAKSNFITAVLRKESGAVISDSEFDREDKKYFPQINDSPAVIKQKENARKLAIKAIEVQAGPGAKNIQQLQPSVGGGVDLSNPLLR